MANISYTHGLHDLGSSVYAYMQPDGSWGWSNAGLIVSGEHALLVDTLFDLTLTQRMLDDMRRATSATIDTVVNTHANGDHCWGNQLVAGARIIASRSGAAEMADIPPAMLAQLVKTAPAMGALGSYIQAIFGSFRFADITLTPPTEVFDGTMTLELGDKTVELIEVGPAHTRGDIVVHVPGDKVVFTGDILFHQGHPIIWAGPVESWIAACQRILDLEPAVVVPGHGPLADSQAVRRMQHYFERLLAETRARYQAGLGFTEAVKDIAADILQDEGIAEWTEPERLVANVAAIYRQLGATDVPGNVIELFTAMAAFARDRGLYGLS